MSQNVIPLKCRVSNEDSFRHYRWFNLLLDNPFKQIVQICYVGLRSAVNSNVRPHPLEAIFSLEGPDGITLPPEPATALFSYTGEVFDVLPLGCPS